jgi:RimJ/RimL family protein N-acetyltransferase
VDELGWKQVAAWWAELLGVDAGDLWSSGVSVAPHVGLEDVDGLLVVRREDGLHVSLPSWVAKADAKDLRSRSADDLMDKKFWSDWAPTSERKVHRRVLHAYSDRPLSPSPAVERIEPAEVAGWEDLLSPRKWQTSGFADDVLAAYGIRSGKDLAAAANLTVFRGSPPTLGVLTHPAYRGQGLATRVARTAAAAAVAEHGIARYRAEAEHARSQAIGRTLGFQPYCEELTIR